MRCVIDVAINCAVNFSVAFSLLVLLFLEKEGDQYCNKAIICNS
jgi:hypothetical protein